MRCSCPILMKDRTGRIVKVPCGQCMSCRLNNARMWSIRIMHETKYHEASCFLTLTYSDEHLPEDGMLHKEDLQNFFKKLRKYTGLKLRYYACGEYGDKSGRPHYHAIVFGLPLNHSIFEKMRYDNKSKGYMGICRAWSFGWTYVGNVTVDSANYVAGYVTKKLKGKRKDEISNICDSKFVDVFSVMSRRPGIGFGFVADFADYIAYNGFTVAKGIKYSIPRYYKELIRSGLLGERAKVSLFKKLIEWRKKNKEDEKNFVDTCDKNGVDWTVLEMEREHQRDVNVKSKCALKSRKG